MKLPAIVIAGIERTFNGLLQEQPDVVPTELSDKVLSITLDGPDVDLYFFFQPGRVVVLDEYQHEPHASITGTPIALASIGLGNKANTSDIQIAGDLQVAQDFEALLAKLSFDWEEQLSRYTGDVIAFRVGELVRGFSQWGKRAASDFAEDTRDYLQLEAKRLPLPNEVETFNQTVDELRAAVERFEMRLNRFIQRQNADSHT